MLEKAKAAVLASFAADALSLGAHWIYNTNVIDKKLGRVTAFVKPELASYHKGKEKGDLTHYGDQTLVLLESVAAENGFDLEDFARRWQGLFAHYGGYVDGATRETLKRFEAGASADQAGSSSTDLGGAARIAPLLHRYRKDVQTLVAACRRQTAMTHNHPLVIDAADFFARLGRQVLVGTAPKAALETLAAKLDPSDPVRRMVENGLASRQTDTRKAIAEFGQMCETEAALPSTVHLIARYENDLKEALVENVMAGGDSASRGLLTGMILGAHLGGDAIPEPWLSGLNRHDAIVALLGRG